LVNTNKEEPHKGNNKLLLIPPLPNLHSQDQADHFMPLGIFALMASLKDQGIEAALLTPSRRLYTGDDYKDLVQEIIYTGSPVVGFSTWCVSYATSLILAEKIKIKDPSVTILFGGPHASVTAFETLKKYPFVDFVLKGEADESLPLFMSAFQIGNKQELFSIPGLMFRHPKTQEVVASDVKTAIPDMNVLPMPAYHLCKTKTVKLDVGRGCPFRCTYCSTSDFFSRKFRTRSVNQIMNEMDHCYKTMGITSFGFSHDNFTCSKQFVLDLCGSLHEYFKENRISFKWTCSSRPDTVDEEMLIAMKKAGCTNIFFGIESGSEEIQKCIRKNLKMDKVLDVAQICHEQGIRMNASFMGGFPEEETNDIDETIRMMIKLAGLGARVQVSLLSLLPGTPLYKLYHDQLKLDGRFSDFSAYRPTEAEWEMIQEDPGLFSSFYYLPNQNFKRDHLFAFSRLVNDLREFPKTCQFLASRFLEDLNRQALFTPIMEALEKYRTHNPEFTELLFVIDQLNHLLSQRSDLERDERNQDILVMESAQAIVKRKFLVHRIPEIWTNNDTDNGQIEKTNLIVLPHWVVIKSHTDISNVFDIVKDNFKDFKSERYYYLVFAVNERKSGINQLTEAEYEVCKKIKTTTVIENIQRNAHIMKEVSIQNLFRWLQVKKLLAYTN
jgi:radical SAM superfamily enzyme YgiQ (UPF0313 family)